MRICGLSAYFVALERAVQDEMITQFHVKSMFNRQLARHLAWIEEYPNRANPTPGPALTGLANERPETRQIYTAPADLEGLPFTPEQIGNYPVPFSASDM